MDKGTIEIAFVPKSPSKIFPFFRLSICCEFRALLYVSAIIGGDSAGERFHDKDKRTPYALPDLVFLLTEPYLSLVLLPRRRDMLMKWASQLEMQAYVGNSVHPICLIVLRLNPWLANLELGNFSSLFVGVIISPLSLLLDL